jgi:hypothetical protein
VTIVGFIPGPTKVLREERADLRWCFQCRRRLPGTHVLLADEQPSYYEPVWAYRCDGCGRDGRYFPGCGPA